MAVIKEFRCAKHGDFEGTHPICPSYGCFSENVERIFKTPVSVSRGKYSRFDAGLRNTADRMNISNWRTARAGDTSFAGRAPLGSELLWGDEVAKVPEFHGRNFAQLTQQAAQPLNIATAQPNDPYVRVNNGMRVTATESGITQSRLPKAEFTSVLGDPKAVPT